MDAKTRYKLSESEAMHRLQELQDASPRLSDDDIAVTRFLIERSIESNPSLADKLLQTLARLTSAADTSAEKHGDLIPRNRLIELTNDLMTSVIECFEDSCDDWTDRIDRLARLLTSKLEKSNECT